MAVDNNRNLPSDKTVPAFKTVRKSLGQCSFASNSDVSAVDVKDGKILRIRPFRYDEKYSKEEIQPWKIEKNGRVLEAPLKTKIAPYQLAYKQRVYSPNRILYPLKRVDWDPKGERNPQNRGKSKYVRISWEEAVTLITDEIKRVQAEYGPYALLCHGDGHGESKTIHGPHACHMKLMEKAGGYTQAVRNADSWEGWYWGAEHMWGTGACGLMDHLDNVMNDIIQHSQMLVHIGSDLETTPWGFAGQFPSQLCYFWSSIGIKQVYISPDLNYAAAIHADKWIPILPNTDAALLLAVAYTWISEDSYDKEYVATHTVGFDKFKDYVMGQEDGQPKTAEWAAAKCGVAAWTITALARQWAQKITSTVHYYGGSYIRGPYSHEPARLEIVLLGMQGLGKPGIHQYSRICGHVTGGQLDVPRPKVKLDLIKIRNQVWPGRRMMAPTPQLIPKTLLHQAILNPPVTTWGSTSLGVPVEDQFTQYVYPIPREQGGTEIHMIWMDNPCRTTCWNGGYKTIEAFRSPKIECLVVQHPWLENDTILADIILPVNTKLEEEDVAAISIGAPLKGLSIEDKAIESLGDSVSDYEAVGKIAQRLGLYAEYSDNMDIPAKIKLAYEVSGLKDLISWENFKAKGYYIIPTAEDWQNDSPGLRAFYADPEKHPLQTPSGKLEIYSEKIAKHFPTDEERPPVPKWIENGPTHNERISSERAKKYPLLLMSNHGRWRTHAQNDDIAWLREIPTCKVTGRDGYKYEPLWLNPVDAVARGIRDGDIVKVYNELGIVLGGARVWERLRQGVAYMDHGARADIIAAGEEGYIDRGGAINLISPENGTSKNCWGMATSGYLVEVAKVTDQQMAEWQQQYPDNFARKYDPAAGLRFEAWVEE
jgi:trimethylamine-N-oxide reductase (cytochrome c)